MTKSSFTQLMELDGSAQRALRPFAADIAIPQAREALEAAIRGSNRSQEQAAKLLGTLEKSSQLTRLDGIARLESLVMRINDIEKAYERQFCLPIAKVISSLLVSLETDTRVQTSIRNLGELAVRVVRAAESMSVAWLSTANSPQSLMNFAGLQHIGEILKGQPAFGVTLANELRRYLGDWRGRIVMPAEISTDPAARIEFYAARGFNSGLTSFPSNTFDECISVAGIKYQPPPIVSGYSDQSEHEVGDLDMANFGRMSRAFQVLHHFETQIRKFIEEKMTEAFGENWIHQYVAGDVREDWKRKKVQAHNKGAGDHRLIAYADFTHYEKIILQRNNWGQVFGQVFGRKTLIQESFQRLYPIRLCTMHGRVITQEDELFLYVETTRLLRAMGVIN